MNTVVAHDTVTVDGKPNEDTLDWFAQDRDGNVWYFGEATKAFDTGTVDTTGSFEAGVDGAVLGPPTVLKNLRDYVADRHDVRLPDSRTSGWAPAALAVTLLRDGI